MNERHLDYDPEGHPKPSVGCCRFCYRPLDEHCFRHILRNATPRCPSLLDAKPACGPDPYAEA